MAVLRSFKSRVFSCLQYASEIKQKIFSHLSYQNVGHMDLSLWQLWFLCIQKNNNGEKGQRKGTSNHMKGRGTSGEMMID